MTQQLKTISIGLLAIIMLLFSQVAYTWENESNFIDITYLVNGFYLLLHSIIIMMLVQNSKQKRIAYILLLINIVLVVSYLNIIL